MLIQAMSSAVFPFAPQLRTKKMRVGNPRITRVCELRQGKISFSEEERIVIERFKGDCAFPGPSQPGSPKSASEKSSRFLIVSTIFSLRSFRNVLNLR